MGAPQYEQAGADVAGSGTTNTIPRWTGPSTLGDSGLIDDSTSIYTSTRRVGVDTSTTLANVKLQVGTAASLANYQGAPLGVVLPTGSGSWFELAENSASGTSFRISKDSSTGVVFNTNGKTIGFTAAGYTTAISSSQVVLTTAGNVGIGETSPSSYGRLAVTGSAVGAGILGFNTDATRCDVQSYNKPLAINRAGNNTLMNEGGGNVGIGTASPTATSTIYKANNSLGEWNAQDLSVNGLSNGDGIFQRWYATGVAGAVGRFGVTFQSGVASFVWNSLFNGGVQTAELMRLTGTGNLIIGTTSGTGALNVYRGAATDSYIEVSGGGRVIGSKSVFYGQDSTGSGYVWNRENQPVYFGTNNTSRWAINSSGHILAGADNTYDIGASGATRPRIVYVGTGVVGGYIRAGAASAGVASTTTIGNGTSTTATAGAETLPANPLGFIIAHVGTTEVRIPYYAV